MKKSAPRQFTLDDVNDYLSCSASKPASLLRLYLGGSIDIETFLSEMDGYSHKTVNTIKYLAAEGNEKAADLCAMLGNLNGDFYFGYRSFSKGLKLMSFRVVEDLTLSEGAARLAISVDTANKYISNLKRILNCANSLAMIVRLIDLGLLTTKGELVAEVANLSPNDYMKHISGKLERTL